MRTLRGSFSKVNKLLEGNVSIYLDLIRGVSAILVVMEHLSSRLFVGYGNVDYPNLLVQSFYLLNILGGPAVIIFFVLSGLFISRSVLKALFENNWSWKSYLVNRFSRLYVVLIPALILTFILDSVAMNFFEFQRYDNAFSNLGDFMGNLFFLQGVFVGVYGTNYPLWSLSYEFWYYMLFPLLLLLFSRTGKLFKFTYLLIAIIILSTIGTKMTSYFFIWLIGTSVLLLPRVNLLRYRLLPILSLLFLFLAMIVRPLAMTGRLFTDKWTEDLFFVDIFVGIAFGFFVYTLLHFTSNNFKKVDLKWVGKISKLLAGFSFTLYLIHYPLINAVYRWGEMNGFTGLQPSLFSIGVEIVLITLICIIAYFFSILTEAKTSVVRKFIKGNISLKRKQAGILRKDNVSG